MKISTCSIPMHVCANVNLFGRKHVQNYNLKCTSINYVLVIPYLFEQRHPPVFGRK